LGTQNNVLTMNRSDCDIYHVLQSDSLGAVAGTCNISYHLHWYYTTFYF